MGECDWDGDWAITLYQFKWGVNSFGMSSVIVCVLRLMSNKEVKPPVLVFGTEQV